MGWTDERIAMLRKLWLDGLSAGQIAKQLGGVTRNAVIGKVHRLGLVSTGRAAPSTPFLRAPKAPKPARPIEQKPRAALPKSTQASTSAAVATPHVFVDRIESPGSMTILTSSKYRCKWPIGDPSSDGFSLCGRGINHDRKGPYCEEHDIVAFQPSTKKYASSGAAELARSLRRYL
jgi:GcrA cell cycle regulator